jgi:hypothetical protein
MPLVKWREQNKVTGGKRVQEHFYDVKWFDNCMCESEQSYIMKVCLDSDWLTFGFGACKPLMIVHSAAK